MDSPLTANFCENFTIRSPHSFWNIFSKQFQSRSSLIAMPLDISNFLFHMTLCLSLWLQKRKYGTGFDIVFFRSCYLLCDFYSTNTKTWLRLCSHIYFDFHRFVEYVLNSVFSSVHYSSPKIRMQFFPCNCSCVSTDF